MKKIFITTIAISAIVLFSCKKEEAEDPNPTPKITVKYATDIQPIFTASCGTGGNCHGSSRAADGKVYETHAGASAVAGSKTKGAINHSSGFNEMPKNGTKLSSSKIEKIEAWIDGGMKND